MQKQGKKKPERFAAKSKPKYPLGEAKILQVPNQGKIKLNTFFGSQGNQIFSLRFSNHDKMLATGTINGDIKVYNVAEGNTLTIARSWGKAENPTTCVRWKPGKEEAGQHYLVGTSTEGTVTWLKSTGEIIERVHLDSPILCCDYLESGHSVVVGKQDFSIEVLCDNTKSTQRVYSGSTPDDQNRNHSNRVFSIKHVPNNPNEFISGGWDSNIKIWDTREKESVRNIFGPHISGDSIDFKNNQILTGSYRNNDILQLWDYGTGKLIQTLDLNLEPHQASYCYTAQFGTSNLIGCDLSVSNNVILLKQGSGFQKSQIVNKIQLHDTCYNIHFSNQSHQMAIGGAEGVVYIFSV